jgi:hypothetical protein
MKALRISHFLGKSCIIFIAMFDEETPELRIPSNSSLTSAWVPQHQCHPTNFLDIFSKKNSIEVVVKKGFYLGEAQKVWNSYLSWIEISGEDLGFLHVHREILGHFGLIMQLQRLGFIDLGWGIWKASTWGEVYKKKSTREGISVNCH